jgi:hypothetical protein
VPKQLVARVTADNGLAEYRNRHRGRAYIFGTGTSLNTLGDDVLHELGRETTFATNYLARWSRFATTGDELACGLFNVSLQAFAPTYWCLAESAALIDIARYIWGIPCPKFLANPIRDDLGRWAFDHWNHDHPGSAVTWHWVDRRPYFNQADERVCSRLSWGHWYVTSDDGKRVRWFTSGGSVVLDCALPLAVWMGCTDIVFLGVDIDDQGHVYDRPDEIRPLYPRHKDAMLKSVPVVRELLARRGVRLWRGTPGGQLDLPEVVLQPKVRGGVALRPR